MRTININQELFKRYKPGKKLDLIYQLKADELLAVTPDTIKRIVNEEICSKKETGDYIST